MTKREKLHRPRLIASSVLAVLALASAGSALAAKDAVLAIGGQPETLDPYNTNTTLTTAVTKSFYQGLFILCPFALPLRQTSSCISVMYQRVHSFIHDSSSLWENKIAIV